MARYSSDELQELVAEEPREIENQIKDQLKASRAVALEELVENIEEPQSKVENAVRHLLQRQEIGETADWKFYIAQDTE